MAIESDATECFHRLSEVLQFIHTGFLRVSIERGFQSEDLISALAAIALSAIDSLRAALLLLDLCDFSNAEAALHRFEEHFALMIYFALCDDGQMLTRWFQNPKLSLSDNPKVRDAIDNKAATLFKLSPGYSFQDRLREMSQQSVHATWHSVHQGIVWSAGRYGMVTPEARNAALFAEDLREPQAAILLVLMVPSAARFIEFLRKEIFPRAEFADASPGAEFLSELDADIVRWWQSAWQRLNESEGQPEHAEDGENRDGASTEKDGKQVADSTSHSSSRAGALFESEAHRLAWLIHEIEKRIADVPVEPPKTYPGELFWVTSSWLQMALAQSKAILGLLQQELHAGAGPLHRALWELWIDWRYLLRVGDRRLNAVKVLLNAQIEAIEYFEKIPNASGLVELSSLRDSIRTFELEHPQACKEVREQRKNRRYHWSGLSRSAMERKLEPQHPSLYRPFSWEAHGIMAPIRDVRIAQQGDTMSIQFGKEEQNMLLNAHFLPYSSGGALFYMYNEYADLWGLRPVDLPGAEAGGADAT